MLKIDALDAKLIYLHGRNSRLSYAAMAKALRTSREVVAFRMQRLQEKGILNGSTVNINYYRLGMSYFQILLRERGSSEDRLNQLEQFLIAHPLITSVQRTFGSWDYLIMARARSIQQLAKLLDELTSLFPEAINTNHFYIMDEFGPGWGFVVPEENRLPNVPKDRIAFTKIFEQREQRELSSLDETDEHILLRLGKDARTSMLQIAESAGIAYRTALKRTQRMIEDGIIESFDARGNLRPLGFSQRTVLLRIRNIAENDTRAREFFNSLRECSRYWRLLGTVQFRLNLFTKTTEDFEKTLRKIRTFFKSDLLEVECLDILGQKKSIGFPAPLAIIKK